MAEEKNSGKNLIGKELNGKTDNKQIQNVVENKKRETFSDKLGKIVSKGTNYIVDSAKDVLKNNMKEGFKKIFIKASIKYVIIFIGVFIVIFEPINFFVSNLTASILFIGVFVWTLISSIKVIKNYYKLPICVIKEKNLHNGAWKFIKIKWPGVAKGITGYNIARSIGCLFSKNFEDMPVVEDTVKDFLKYILKDLIIFVSFFLLYFITVNLVIKPILLVQFAGIHTWEIYLFPFVQIKDFIVFLIK